MLCLQSIFQLCVRICHQDYVYPIPNSQHLEQEPTNLLGTVEEGKKERQTKVVLFPDYKDGDIRAHEYSLPILPFPNQQTRYLKRQVFASSLLLQCPMHDAVQLGLQCFLLLANKSGACSDV